MAKLSKPYTLESIGKEAGEWAFNNCAYKGLTLKEWADKIASGEYEFIIEGKKMENSIFNIDCSKIDSLEPRKMLVRNYCLRCVHLNKEGIHCDKDCAIGRCLTELYLGRILSWATEKDGDSDG